MDKGLAAHSIGFLDQGLHQSGLTAVELNQDLLALLQAHSAADQELGEFADTGIFHGGSSLSFQSLRVTAQKNGREEHLFCPAWNQLSWYRASRDRLGSLQRVTALTISMAITEAGTATMAHWMP